MSRGAVLAWTFGGATAAAILLILLLQGGKGSGAFSIFQGATNPPPAGGDSGTGATITVSPSGTSVTNNGPSTVVGSF